MTTRGDRAYRRTRHRTRCADPRRAPTTRSWRCTSCPIRRPATTCTRCAAPRPTPSSRAGARWWRRATLPSPPPSAAAIPTDSTRHSSARTTPANAQACDRMAAGLGRGCPWTAKWRRPTAGPVSKTVLSYSALPGSSSNRLSRATRAHVRSDVSIAVRARPGAFPAAPWEFDPGRELRRDHRSVAAYVHARVADRGRCQFECWLPRGDGRVGARVGPSSTRSVLVTRQTSSLRQGAGPL